MKKDTSNKVHYETFAKKHENWQKTHGVGENNKNPTTSLISSDKKDRKMLRLGLKSTVHYQHLNPTIRGPY